ncbi:NUDIX domain-containing protein [Haloplasma contractile]|uniref:Nucleoside polyphosphate hydrolase protein n=1 Tax=Haloplasma contractile SSD-17B TaxID=1033810 RepID=U2FJT7_9MOLU|nr:NUDIX domain-containing protein [Haloplasma contractile]ERJ13080.1 putative nucleoside polyphosphate hydrolase protein [Haloplasma contractile SSD-17B]
MELLKEICTLNDNHYRFNSDALYTIRKAARCVLFNEKNDIALLYVAKHHYHKLPGGGIEQAEDIIEALKREVREEIGVTDLKVEGDLGIVIEYRDLYEPYLMQLSYGYIARVKGEVMDPTFTEREIENGFRVKWLSLDEAIHTLEQDDTSDRMGQYIKIRDLEFLKKARGQLR